MKNSARKALWRMVLCFLVAAANALAGPALIKFRTERAGLVSINVYSPDGYLVRALLNNERLSAGEHSIPWDGKSAPPPAGSGEIVPAGEYTWRGLFHEGIGLKLRGWAAGGNGAPWRSPDGHAPWGGGGDGEPSAVAADDARVYLGWSFAGEGNPVVACDPGGRVLWTHRREEGASGCHALAVDGGLVYVLGGQGTIGVAGGVLYRLDAKDGKPVPWPDGKFDLTISTLWPADSQTKPESADAMAVRHGHIYLSFTSSQFLTVLDAVTGAYLQTVVGAPPGMIDVAPTKSTLPDAPDKLVDADFGVISLGGGVLGRILFAHDPFWVITSDMAPLDRDVKITALTVIGDGAKYHMHTAFVGFGAPFHQVQARPLLDMENPKWTAGRLGGRALVGPWQGDSFHSIRGVALAADGKLWVAEGDPYPGRFSVWDTTGTEGKLVHEYFGPPGDNEGVINPSDPDLMVAQNCEWRIDRKTGQARCLGVISRDPLVYPRFGVGENGHVYLVAAGPHGASPISIFERIGDGDYKLRTRIYLIAEDGTRLQGFNWDVAKKMVIWSDRNGDGEEQPDEREEFSDPVEIEAAATMADLTLIGLSKGQGPRPLLSLKVASWTECGAPKYRLDNAKQWPKATSLVSADSAYYLAPTAGPDSAPACYDSNSGQKLWEVAKWEDGFSDSPRSGGTARLPPPLKNVWILESAKGTWHLLTEDGFDLAEFLCNDFQKARWPKSAAPGADLTNAASEGYRCGGTLTHAVDGKLYLETGKWGYWNTEITGLEKVKALAGGKITLSPPK